VIQFSASGVIAIIVLVTTADRRCRLRLGYMVLIAALVSLSLTGWSVVNHSDQESGWVVLELLGLGALLLLSIRSLPFRARLGVTALLAGVQLLVPLRHTSDHSESETAALFILVTLWVVSSALSGLYLRSLDDAKVQAAQDARQAERFELARALHDYLAHDITGIVVRSQAALHVAQTNTDEPLAALAHIERSGRSALETLERTVQTLRSRGAEADAAYIHPGIEALDELVERFEVTDAIAVTLTASLDGRALTSDLSALLYRISVEALTNVRRHGVAVTKVELTLGLEDNALEVEVSNNGSTIADITRSGGGLGIADLAEAVRAHGGVLSAGPEATGGWKIHATVPLDRD
jgi:signal transduction histidine kinase